MSDSVGSAQPPVRPLTTRLPLHELSPDVFEQFSAALAHALHPRAGVHRYGGQGHTQGGIDVIVNHLDGLPTGIQCKREQEFGPAKVRKAVSELTIEVEHCYIFLTRVATPQARQEVAKHPSWTLWDIEDLSREVRSLQDRDAAIRIVDTYFPGWRESFLGVRSPSPWLTTEEFFRPFVEDGIYSHGWDLVGRSVESTALQAHVGDPDRNGQIAIVAGRGGIGKSRLLRAVVSGLDTENHVNVRFLGTGLIIEPQHYEVLPPDDGLLVVIDDVHDRDDTAAIVAGIRQFRPAAKVLLSLRPYGLAQLFADLRKLGIHPSDVPRWELDDLTVQDAETLAKAILGPNIEPHVARLLATLTPDCPLLIVVGATLISRGKLDPTRLEASEDIREEILRLFGAVVADAPGIGETELRREVLKTVAVLQPFRLDHPDFQAAASALTKRPFDQVMPHLTALQNAGVLLRRGESVRIVPDLLGDVLLGDAAVGGPSGASTGYLERVCSATSKETLGHAVINAGRLDWQTRRGGSTASSAVGVLWTALTAEYETGDLSTQRRILQAVRHVAAFQPVHAIALIHIALSAAREDISSADPADLAATGGVIRDLPGILYRAAFDLDHLPEAADLMWRLAEQDTRPLHQNPEHPVRLLAELAEYAVGKPAEFQHSMISAAERWLRNDDVAQHAHSPFVVLEPILATEAEQQRFDGLTLTLSAYPVDVDAARPLRDRVIDLAFDESRSDNVRRAVRAVQALEAALRYPTGAFGRTVGGEERDSWSPHFVAILDRLGELAAHPGLDPVVAVMVRQAVQWHAQYATGETAGAAQAVLSRLPQDTEHRLAQVLHDGWGRPIPDLGDYETWSHRQEEHFTEVAAAVRECWTPEEVIDHLIQRLTLDRFAYGSDVADPIPFVLTLVRRHPEVAVSVVRRVISDGSGPKAAESKDALVVIRDLVPVALSTLTELRPVEAMSLARALIETPDVIDTRAAARAFGLGRGSRTTLLDGEAALLHNLVAHADPQVRRHAVSAARLLGEGNRDLVLQLVTGVRFDGDTELAAEVAAVLKSSGTVSWNHLTDAQITDILDQLHACPSIDNHHIASLLAVMSIDRPEQILDLLVRRVEGYEHDPAATGYRPLPYRWHRPLRFRDGKDFERLLRRVLNWIAENPTSWIRERMGAQIFAAVAGHYDEPVLKVLSDTVTCGSSPHVLAVGSVLGSAPRSLAWSHSTFVIEALQAAEKLGDNCISAVAGGLESAAIRGSGFGTIGQPHPEDVEQRRKAIEFAKSLSPGTIEHRFYLSLASSAEFLIKRKADRDGSLDDRRSW